MAGSVYRRIVEPEEDKKKTRIRELAVPAHIRVAALAD
jgi:hypothetical protein